eukprot:scaffold77574_cov59-Phaeocystis_antarctica.AAC.2
MAPNSSRRKLSAGSPRLHSSGSAPGGMLRKAYLVRVRVRVRLRLKGLGVGLGVGVGVGGGLGLGVGLGLGGRTTGGGHRRRRRTQSTCAVLGRPYSPPAHLFDVSRHGVRDGREARVAGPRGLADVGAHDVSVRVRVRLRVRLSARARARARARAWVRAKARARARVRASARVHGGRRSLDLIFERSPSDPTSRSASCFVPSASTPFTAPLSLRSQPTTSCPIVRQSPTWWRRGVQVEVESEV